MASRPVARSATATPSPQPSVTLGRGASSRGSQGVGPRRRLRSRGVTARGRSLGPGFGAAGGGNCCMSRSGRGWAWRGAVPGARRRPAAAARAPRRCREVHLELPNVASQNAATEHHRVRPCLRVGTRSPDDDTSVDALTTTLCFSTVRRRWPAIASRRGTAGGRNGSFTEAQGRARDGGRRG